MREGTIQERRGCGTRGTGVDTCRGRRPGRPRQAFESQPGAAVPHTEIPAGRADTAGGVGLQSARLARPADFLRREAAMKETAQLADMTFPEAIKWLIAQLKRDYARIQSRRRERDEKKKGN